MSYWEDVCVTHNFIACKGRKAGKPLGPDAPHYPNKAERKLLTKMMQASGQTEEEVRADKNNRRKLAEAAKSMAQGTPGDRSAYEAKILRRRIASTMNLPATHPDVAAEFNRVVRTHFGKFRGISVSLLSRHL